MNVSVCLVTRGDVDLQPVIDSLPADWEVVIWDNGERRVSRSDGWAEVCPDLSVYGRYAAIEYASHDLIYIQDDDVIVSDPQSVIAGWDFRLGVSSLYPDEFLVANMPPEFRHDGYTDSCLVGFGACFHRGLPRRVFDLFRARMFKPNPGWFEDPWFQRTCDVVFTTLTPRVLVDVPKEDREFASNSNRMWKQPSHYGERVRMLELARQARDA